MQDVLWSMQITLSSIDSMRWDDNNRDYSQFTTRQLLQSQRRRFSTIFPSSVITGAYARFLKCLQMSMNTSKNSSRSQAVNYTANILTKEHDIQDLVTGYFWLHSVNFKVMHLFSRSLSAEVFVAVNKISTDIVHRRIHLQQLSFLLNPI